MSLYAYCIAPAGHEPGALRGLDDAPVGAETIAGLTVWVSALDERPHASIDAIRRHNGVVEASVAGGVTTLPVRFGQWFAERELLEAQLAERADALAARLEEVAGALEFGVRVLDPTAPSVERAPERAASGTAYLESLAARRGATRERESRADALAHELADAVGGLARVTQVRKGGGPRALLEVAHLVGRHDFGGYRGAVHGVRQRHPALRFLVSGPWPPYSFTP